MLAWLQANWGYIAAVLYVLCEVLANTPGIAANSVFQLIFGWLKGQQKPPAA